MAIHCVFISSTRRPGKAIDRVLRTRFHDVHRLGDQVWLVDSAHDADRVAATLEDVVNRKDGLFVAGLTRDYVPALTSEANGWLTAPERSWRQRGNGLGAGGEAPSFLSAAA